MLLGRELLLRQRPLGLEVGRLAPPVITAVRAVVPSGPGPPLRRRIMVSLLVQVGDGAHDVLVRYAFQEGRPAG
ncbi:hypothetical protein R6L23_04200 [Streptomyces sp. SR27]|uniref:hypothetical protein n=1 Tax=Streptomyces sp. SR27 TaxID=3076630 RepID=UPI00295B4C40|nr:hypothetical protein [Streptomyces sp. SR27]MDV9187428.1 hypothetical protein [Streptomyces sp. SR27]